MSYWEARRVDSEENEKSEIKYKEANDCFVRVRKKCVD